VPRGRRRSTAAGINRSFAEDNAGENDLTSVYRLTGLNTILLFLPELLW